jgi:hypothetical protein
MKSPVLPTREVRFDEYLDSVVGYPDVHYIGRRPQQRVWTVSALSLLCTVEEKSRTSTPRSRFNHIWLASSFLILDFVPLESHGRNVLWRTLDPTLRKALLFCASLRVESSILQSLRTHNPIRSAGRPSFNPIVRLYSGFQPLTY